MPILLISVVPTYFTFAGTTTLTINLFLYQWLSLLTKDTPQMILLFFANLTDFGLIFILTLYCVYIIKDYTSIMINSIKVSFNFVSRIGKKWDALPLADLGCCFYFMYLFAYLILIGIICGVFALIIYIIINWLYWVAIVCECFLLFQIFFGTLYFKFYKKKLFKNISENECYNTDSMNNIIDETVNDNNNEEESNDNNAKNGNNEELNDINDEGSNDENEEEDQMIKNQNDKDQEKKQIESDIYELYKDNIFYVAQLDGMFDKTEKPVLCVKHPTIYKIIVSIIIMLLQLYSIIYPFYIKSITLKQFLIYLFCRLIYSIKICSFNLIDLIGNGKRVFKSLKQIKAKIVLIAITVLYVVVIIGFVTLFVFSKMAIFPTIDNALFYENNEKWYKFDNLTIKPEGFCLTHAAHDGSLITEDYSMLATLPRLYGTTKDGKCFIKPSMRGIFNTTMKYIFGKNYEEDNIYILCKKLSHYPYLVISSEKLLNETLLNFQENDVTVFESQFKNVTNKNNFENIIFTNLNQQGKKLLQNYEDCTSKQGTANCENEWDQFTQFYWPNMHSEEYEDLPGFERYQINIDSKTKIQLSFITKNGKLWSGTHYIVGGSYEDRWSVGVFIETIGRKYIPNILENFLPLYSFVKSLANDIFLRIDNFNRNLFYFEISSSKEMNLMASLIGQFNFTNQALYTIGHSISGTIFKGLSFLHDIHGISFEASDGENNMIFLKNPNLIKNGKANSQTTNIYSTGTIFTGIDENCDVNGALPKRYIFPSVYDTACLTAITCSESKKCLPFCQQVLTQNKKDPMKEFNTTFDAYLNFYGYQ